MYGFVEDDVVSEVNGMPAVFIRVDATERQSIADMGDDIRTWLEGYDPPQDVAISVWNDRAQPALDRMSAVARNGLAGAILVFVLLVLVFDLRAATWISDRHSVLVHRRPDVLRSGEPDAEHRHAGSACS